MPPVSRRRYLIRRTGLGLALGAAVATAAWVALAVRDRSEPAEPTLRIGHANLAGWPVYRGHPSGGDDLAGLVTDNDLDVLGVSEVCSGQLDVAIHGVSDSQLLFQPTVSPDHPLPYGPDGVDCAALGLGFVLGDRVELIESFAWELPSQDPPGIGFDPVEDRWLLCARMTVSGEPLVACNTHVANLVQEPELRRRQLDAVASQMSGWLRPGERAVLVGDFNARPGDPDLTAVDSMMEPTTSGRRVIGVYVTTGGWTVIDDASADLGRSDHDAVWTELRTV